MGALANYSKTNTPSNRRGRITQAAANCLARLGLAMGLLLLGACATTGAVNTSIDAYLSQAPRVKLGQSMDKVLSILQPTQANMPAKFAKPAEEFIDNGKTKKIYFFRSRSFPDGLVTDDEFTPYVFEDGVQVAIGWTAIGGPKTQAQSREQNYDYHFHGRIYHY